MVTASKRSVAYSITPWRPLEPSAIEGIGLKNTRERLAALYGGDAHFSVVADQGAVLALLDLPWKTLA